MHFFKTSLFLLSAFWIPAAQADINSYYSSIQTNPTALTSFFKAMPKGGELHYHLAGGPSPETMLSLIANDKYCLDKKTLTVNTNSKKCPEIAAKKIQQRTELYNEIVKSWSMEGFTAGKETGHDHFFKSFLKFMTIVYDYRPQLIVNVLQRAANQNEHYLEILDISDNAHSTTFGPLIQKATTLDEKRELLLKNKAFQENILHTISESDKAERIARDELNCTLNPQQKSCQIRLKFLYYVLREQPLDNFFAQALNAFEAVSRSKGNLIGVNLVQPEDGVISLRDYKQQMHIFNFLHQHYPKVSIALHAGEITPDFVVAKELKDHIRDALFIGQAQRIGHGTDITYETEAKNTLQYMAEHQIPIEINLISNLQVLNISGDKHPLKVYLSHQVPVVFSTDDEGILRTDLTQQYVTAALEHHLSYDTLKLINRNTLTYAFIPGKSLWLDPRRAERVSACKNLDAPSCTQYLSKSEKATLQWKLEKELAVFERQFK